MLRNRNARTVEDGPCFTRVAADVHFALSRAEGHVIEGRALLGDGSHVACRDGFPALLQAQLVRIQARE